MISWLMLGCFWQPVGYELTQQEVEQTYKVKVLVQGQKFAAVRLLHSHAAAPALHTRGRLLHSNSHMCMLYYALQRLLWRLHATLRRPHWQRRQAQQQARLAPAVCAVCHP
jgi:hypothetical protein